MMVVVSVVLVMLATVHVFLWILIERCFTARSAEIVNCVLILRCPLGSLFVNFHITYRVNRH